MRAYSRIAVETKRLVETVTQTSIVITRHYELFIERVEETAPDAFECEQRWKMILLEHQVLNGRPTFQVAAEDRSFNEDRRKMEFRALSFRERTGTFL